jgi:hypothetical protein
MLNVSHNSVAISSQFKHAASAQPTETCAGLGQLPASVLKVLAIPNRLERLVADLILERDLALFSAFP